MKEEENRGFTCIMVLSSVRRVHCATTGNAWHTSISDRGALVFRTTVVKMSMDVCGTEGEEGHTVRRRAGMEQLLVLCN